MVIGPKKPKGFSKKPMKVKEVKRSKWAEKAQRMKWAGTTRMLTNKTQKR